MTRADKIQAVAQQAHDDGDCVCCLPDEMVEFERSDSVTITISRISAEALVDGDVSTEARNACFAALGAER